MGDVGASGGEASGPTGAAAGMTADELKQFIDTGRTGRRNALHDVTSPQAASTSAAGVAEAMESLSVSKTDSGNENNNNSSSNYAVVYGMPTQCFQSL